jgi:hypothetical protein
MGTRVDNVIANKDVISHTPKPKRTKSLQIKPSRKFHNEQCQIYTSRILPFDILPPMMEEKSLPPL